MKHLCTSLSYKKLYVSALNSPPLGGIGVGLLNSYSPPLGGVGGGLPPRIKDKLNALCIPQWLQEVCWL